MTLPAIDFTTRRKLERSRKAASSVPPRSEAGAARRPRVLIVEDHEDTRGLYAWCMRAAGWHVDEVVDGAEAVAIAAAFAPDVIVMDLHLPVLDGIEAARALRRDARTEHIPIVACTAFARQHSVADLQDAGFDYLVVKPCTAEDLRDTVAKLLPRHDP
jgi:CheY-like chemotaxis protein